MAANWQIVTGTAPLKNWSKVEYVFCNGLDEFAHNVVEALRRRIWVWIPYTPVTPDYKKGNRKFTRKIKKVLIDLKRRRPSLPTIGWERISMSHSLAATILKQF